MLKIYNSRTRAKEALVPLHPPKIGLYACGITVYDYCHIGHARTNLAFDIIVRYLRYRYPDHQVTYVRNITDIDDKIIQRAAHRQMKWQDLVTEFTHEMYQDFDALNLLRPDLEPRATETLPEIFSIIQTLLDKGVAYQPANQDVYFDVSQFKTYGALSGQNLAALQAGERVEANPYKRNPLDFVLWKSAKPHEPSFGSPFGPGRPGWHIECSAMTYQTLGIPIDIHGGGSDLLFPHHENEVAQSEAAHDCRYANIWMHTGMVQINQEKMSKSLGNFFKIREVLEEYHPEVVRFFLLSGHYRSALNYSDENLKQAKMALRRLYIALRDGAQLPMPKVASAESLARFQSLMDDDFNVPGVMAVCFELANEIQRDKHSHPERAGAAVMALKAMGAVLGIFQNDPVSYLQEGASTELILEKIAARNQARKDKNWALADQIRQELLSKHGIHLADGSEGETDFWKA